MFKLTARFKSATKIYNTEETVKVGSRENAEYLANEYYDCTDAYAVEIIDDYTGELLYYKAKS